MRLSEREIVILCLAAVIILTAGLYLLVFEPLAGEQERLEKVTARLETDLAEMESLAAEYKAAAAGQADIEKRVSSRGADFSPFSYLEGLAGDSGLSGRIESMTPVASAAVIEDGRPAMSEVDMRLSGIGLMELVRFLHRLESSDKVFFVVNMNIRPRYLTPDLLDVNLRLASPKTS